MKNNFKDLLAYQKAYKLALEIHKQTLDFPNFEKFELGSQIRRSSKSTATNIAEGFGRKSNSSHADYKRFMRIAIGSNDETKVHLDFCKDLEYLNSDDYNNYLNACQEIGLLLHSMLSWT